MNRSELFSSSVFEKNELRSNRRKINNNTDRTLHGVFLRFKEFFVHNNPEAEAQRISA